MARQPPKEQANQMASIRIHRLHRGENTYVQLVGFDVNMRNDVNMSKIGGITLGQGQSPHMRDLSLMTDLHMGYLRLSLKGRTYEWSLSHVLVALDVDNARPIPGSYYQDVLQPGEIHSQIRSGEEKKVNNESQVQASANAKAGTSVTLLKINIGAEGSIKRDARRGTSSQKMTDVTPNTVFAQAISEYTVEVGGDAGDPLRPDKKDLRGPVIRAYKGTPDDGTPTPLMRLEAIDPTKPVLGRISVRVEKEDFVLNASKKHEVEATALHKALRQDKQAWLQRRQAAEQELCSQVAALAGVRAPIAGKNEAGGAEIDLFCYPFCFEPDVTSAPSEAAP